MQRRPVLTALIAALASLIIGLVIIRDNGRTCQEWQEEYAQVAVKGRGGVLSFINEGPVAERLRELGRERPDDCTTPEL